MSPKTRSPRYFDSDLPLLPPRRRDWAKGKRQVGCFVRTPTGTVMQSCNDNSDADEMEQALDLVTGSLEWRILQRIAKYALEDRATTPGCTRLARALVELATLQGSRGEP